MTVQRYSTDKEEYEDDDDGRPIVRTVDALCAAPVVTNAPSSVFALAGSKLPQQSAAKVPTRPHNAGTQSAEVFVGRECKRGHGGVRYHSNGACVQCCIDMAMMRRSGGKLEAKR